VAPSNPAKLADPDGMATTSAPARSLPVTGERLLPYGLAGAGLLLLGFITVILLSRGRRAEQ
jgi:hypothetical protein